MEVLSHKELILNYLKNRLAQHIQETCCAELSNSLFFLLTGDTMTIEKIYQLEENHNNLYLYDKVTNLFLNPQNDFNINRKNFANEFWIQSKDKIIHNIYMFSLDYSAHNFLIEKYSSFDQSYWCIYQAWKNKYSILQWLGLKKTNNELDTLIDKYGKFKKLNINDMKNAFQDKQLFDYNIKENSDLTMFIYMKPVKNSIESF